MGPPNLAHNLQGVVNFQTAFSDYFISAMPIKSVYTHTTTTSILTQIKRILKLLQ